MSTWIEIRCSRMVSYVCLSSRNEGPMAMAEDHVGNVHQRLQRLQKQAVNEGWKFTKDGLVCPVCLTSED